MCDVVDLLEDSPPPRSKTPEPLPPSDDELRQAIKKLLMGKDLSTISLKALRLDLERGFKLPAGGLDSRKGEIRTLAQDLVVEAQNAPPPAPSTPVPVEPAAKKRRTLTQAVPVAPEGAVSAPASPVKTKAPRKKNAPSAYSLWSLENRAKVVAQLEQELQRKPTFGEIGKAVPEHWKAVNQEERASYEEKAKVAKAQAATEPIEQSRPVKPRQAPAEGSKKGKGKGKGKAKDGEEPLMSRAEFFTDSPVVHCAFRIPGVQADSSMDLVARMFKSQGVGWFSSTKFQVPIGSKEVTVQAQVVMNVSGSKHWVDGEGLDETLKKLESSEAVPKLPNNAKEEVKTAVDGQDAQDGQELQPDIVVQPAKECQAAQVELEAPQPDAAAANPEEEDAKMNDADADAAKADTEALQPDAVAANPEEEDAKMNDADADAAKADTEAPQPDAVAANPEEEDAKMNHADADAAKADSEALQPDAQAANPEEDAKMNHADADAAKADLEACEEEAEAEVEASTDGTCVKVMTAEGPEGVQNAAESNGDPVDGVKAEEINEDFWEAGDA